MEMILKKIKNNMTSFSEHLDLQYSKIGSENRNKYEQEFEAFKLGIMIQELRKQQGLTQEELAIKCNTSVKNISTLENNLNDTKFSSILKILNDGLGVKLTMNLDAKTV